MLRKLYLVLFALVSCQTPGVRQATPAPARSVTAIADEYLAAMRETFPEVNTSKWSRFLGLPVAAWGLLFYIDVFAISLIGTFPRFEDERVISIVLVAEAAVGVLFSAWLTYLELAVIQAICIWCVTSAVIVTLILVVSAADMREFARRGDLAAQ